MSIVVIINCSVAAFVLMLAYRLWHWRAQLSQLGNWLEQLEETAQLSPQQAGYSITLKRIEIAATRLEVAKFQRRSQQLHSIIQLFRLLRSLMLYRTRWPLLGILSSQKSLQRSNPHNKDSQKRNSQTINPQQKEP